MLTAMDQGNYTLVKYLDVLTDVNHQEKICANIEWKIIDFLALFNDTNFKEIRTDLFPVHEECDCSQLRHPKNIRLKIKKRGQQIAVFFLCVPLVPITSEVFYSNSLSLFTYTQSNRQSEHFKFGWQFLDELFVNPSAVSRTGLYKDKSLRIDLKLEMNLKTPDPEKTIYYFLNTTFSDMCLQYQKLLKDGEYSDVTLSSKEGASVKAHKKILAKRSEMFRAMFDHDNTKPDTDIPTSLDEKTLKEMLEWIYTGDSPEFNDITVDLFVAADYYQLAGLKTVCAEALYSQLTVENAVATLELAEKHNCKELLTPTLQYITNGLYDLVTKTEGWKTLQSVDTMKLICESVSENVDPLVESQKMKKNIEDQYLVDICIKKGKEIKSSFKLQVR